MGERLFDTDPLTGLRRFFSYNAADRTFTIRTEQDTTPIENANKAAYNEVRNSAGWKGDLHRVASIPMSKYFELKRQGVLDDPKRFRRWLNDPDNRYFRTRPGRV